MHKKQYRNYLIILILVVTGVMSLKLFSDSNAFMESSPLTMLLLVIFKFAVSMLLWHYARKTYFGFLPSIDWSKKIHKDSNIQLYEVFSIVLYIGVIILFTTYS